MTCLVHAQGHDEALVHFHVRDVDPVFAILKPYKRRQISAEQRQALADRLAKFRFTPHTNG